MTVINPNEMNEIVSLNFETAMDFGTDIRLETTAAVTQNCSEFVALDSDILKSKKNCNKNSIGMWSFSRIFYSVEEDKMKSESIRKLSK